MSDPFEEMDRVLKEIAEKRAERIPEYWRRIVDDLERRGYDVRGKTVEEVEDIVSRPPTKPVQS